MSTPAVHLYDYQRAWVQDSARFKIGMMARQCGKTFTSTLELALDCVQAEAAGQRRRWVILSRGERQARETMQEGVKLHLRAMQAGFKELEVNFDATTKALEVELAGGSRITALPANPDTARGFSASVLLDEFAFHQDSRSIWKALFPVISKPGLKLRVISTPNGKGNKFYELMTGADDGWSRHQIDIYRAVADGLPRDIDELKRGAGDPDLWAQEFELQWLDEASAWLSYELIGDNEHADAGKPELYQGGDCYVGIDIGARNDLFVLWVKERVGDVLWTREILAEKRLSFAGQDALLDAAMRRYQVRGVWMDQTGMGEKPVEDAKRRYGASRVHGVLFTGPSKQHMANVGKESLEAKRERLPAGDPVLRADLHKLRKETGPTGNVRFTAERDASGHADRAWAGFLATAAAVDGLGGPIEFTAVPKHRRGDDNDASDGDDDNVKLRERASW